jgi:hypothetical protein
MNPTALLLMGILLFPMGSLAQPAAAGSPYKARDFGALGHGAAMDTAAVQKAIDACAAGGGGTVYLGPGVYLDLRGSQTADIELAGNQMRNAKTPVRRATEVGRKAVRISH